MKAMRYGFLVLVAALAIMGTSQALAFHDGGVAECSGCHSMHSPQSAINLLQGSDESSTCLNCHEGIRDRPSSYHIATPDADMPAGTPPSNFNPGGDFGWLKKEYFTTASYYARISNWGYEHGHNIVASDFGYTVEPGTNPTAPGGTMAASELGCESCHDPHGTARRIGDAATHSVIRPVVTSGGGTYEPTEESGSYGAIPEAGYAVGVYRLLAGDGYDPVAGAVFDGAPLAVVDRNYNVPETTAQNRVSYGLTAFAGYDRWGDWCASCHPQMHSVTGTVHPVDENLNGTSTIYQNYNWYVKTGDLQGTNLNSYNTLVPIVENEDDITALFALVGDNREGAQGDEHVTCLSCHRAHASAWPYALRWNGEAEFLTVTDASGNPVYPSADLNATNYGQFHRGYSDAEMQAAYYGRPATVFAGYQRSLCNKCHIKD